MGIFDNSFQKELRLSLKGKLPQIVSFLQDIHKALHQTKSRELSIDRLQLREGNTGLLSLRGLVGL
jgi:hypothetical protein